jgi:hypothetical protein
MPACRFVVGTPRCGASAAFSGAASVIGRDNAQVPPPLRIASIRAIGNGSEILLRRWDSQWNQSLRHPGFDGSTNFSSTGPIPNMAIIAGCLACFFTPS